MSRNKKDQENINESDNESDSESARNDKVGTKDYGANNHIMRGENGKQQLESATNSHSGTNFASFHTTVRETVKQLSTTQKAIDFLHGEYKRHADDIQEAIHNREMVAELQAQIHKHEITIETLQTIRSQSKQELDKEKELIAKQKEILAREKEKIAKGKKTEEKRIRALDAERKIREDQEIMTRKEELEKDFEQRTKNLEQEMEKREADHSKRTSDLEAAKNNLSERLTTQEKNIRKQGEELVGAAGKIEDLEILKSTLKTDVQSLKEDLAKVRNEFALNHETEEFYQEKFDRIAKEIEDICRRNFTELDPDNDYQTIHNNLKSSDTCFASVPISDSEDSKKLRSAHAQRVISSYLQRIIWQPFSSEKLLQQGNIIPLLKDIEKELVNSSHPGSGIRAARVWSALTMRALQSLSSTSQGVPLGRAQKFIEDTTKVLSPLIKPSQKVAFEKDLDALVGSAVSVWNSAQTGELEIEIASDLERGARKDWRSPIFDPPEENTTGMEIAPSTRPRIFVLFPRVIARRSCSVTEIASLPGSWPKSEGESRTVETCIHSGIGVAEWSALVVRGKEEVEVWERDIKEEQIIMQQSLENAKKNAEKEAKELIAKKRMGNDKRGSISELTSSPISIGF